MISLTLTQGYPAQSTLSVLKFIVFLCIEINLYGLTIIKLVEIIEESTYYTFFKTNDY